MATTPLTKDLGSAYEEAPLDEALQGKKRTHPLKVEFYPAIPTSPKTGWHIPAAESGTI